jgi:hypothetical protein
MHTLPLKMDYVSQALLVRELMARDPLASMNARLIVEVSGVAMGVADLKRSQGLRFRGVQITAGSEQTQVDGNNHRVAKQLLVPKWKLCCTPVSYAFPTRCRSGGVPQGT